MKDIQNMLHQILPISPSPMSRHRRWWNGTWDDEGATVSPANSPKCRRCCGYLCKKNAVLSNMDRRDFIELWVKTNEQMIAKVMTQQEHGRIFMANTANSLYQESVFSPVSGTKVVGTTISLYTAICIYVVYKWFVLIYLLPTSGWL